MGNCYQGMEAVARIRGGPLAPQIAGTVYFREAPCGTWVSVEVCGLPPYRPAQDGESPIGPHGFHIHQLDSCQEGNPDNPFQSSGGHWNPANQPHGNHAGDFPVLFSNNGYAHMCFFTDKFTVGQAIGHSVIIHQNPDDYRSQPAGNSGKRLACGVIQRLDCINSTPCGGAEKYSSQLNPEKLQVDFQPGVTSEAPVVPRRYTLTHSDATAELFLTVGREYAYDKIGPMRDEVLAEWRYINNGYVFYAHVYVGGPFGPETAAVRYGIFRREMPLALEAIRYGDSAFFNVYPCLGSAPIWIYFESEYTYYNRVEYWGSTDYYRPAQGQSA